MACCIGCGEELPDGFERCSKCGLDKHVLMEIKSVHDKPKFLFGRVEHPGNLSEKEEIQPPARRPRKQSAKKVVLQVETSDDESFIQYRGLDTVKPSEQDELVAANDSAEDHTRVAGKPKIGSERSWLHYTLSIGIDVLILVLLNFLIIVAIAYQTDRSYSTLFVHSLFPLLLANCAISVILFSLFIHFFGYAPGTLVLNKVWRSR